MTILGKISDTIEDDEQERDTGYKVPKVFEQKEEGLTFKKSIILSTALHPATIFAGWLIVFILALMGVYIPLLDKPQPKVQDIEFVLVNKKEEPPIDKNTKNRADRNSRAGGIHDPKKPVAEPSPAPGAPHPAGKQQQAKKQSNPTQDLVKQIQKKQAQQAQQVQKQHTKTQQPAPKHVTPQPAPPAPRPAPKASAPKIVQNPTSAMQIPVPKSTAPRLAAPAGGPVTGTRAGSGTRAGGTGSGRPAPSFTPSSSGGRTSSGGRFSSGQYGSGQAGNPGPGNPKGAPGIDAIREPDFGPYMRELQRRIKMNWDPPKGNESKRVVLFFKIAKDGRLLSVRVSKSSGVQSADRAAISAVELTAPFKPLPPEFKGQNVDIQFTFDYNVFSASRY